MSAPDTSNALVRWTLVTEGEPEITEDGILLRKKGVTMLLRTEGADVTYKIWSSDPRDYESPLKHLEDPIENIYICGYEVVVPAASQVDMITTLKQK